MTIINSKAYLIPILLLLSAAVAWALYLGSRPDPTVRLGLRFHPFVGEELLQLEQGRYANPGGEGVFKVRDFQFFVSNINFVHEYNNSRNTYLTC